MNIDAVTVEISKLVLGKNDYLVIKVPYEMNKHDIKDLEKSLHERFPEINFLIHSNDIELAVIHREDRNED